MLVHALTWIRQACWLVLVGGWPACGALHATTLVAATTCLRGMPLCLVCVQVTEEHLKNVLHLAAQKYARMTAIPELQSLLQSGPPHTAFVHPRGGRRERGAGGVGVVGEGWRGSGRGW